MKKTVKTRTLPILQLKPSFNELQRSRTFPLDALPILIPQNTRFLPKIKNPRFKFSLKNDQKKIQKLMKDVPCNDHLSAITYQLPLIDCVLNTNIGKLHEVYNRDMLLLKEILEIHSDGTDNSYQDN